MDLGLKGLIQPTRRVFGVHEKEVVEMVTKHMWERHGSLAGKRQQWGVLYEDEKGAHLIAIAYFLDDHGRIPNRDEFEAFDRKIMENMENRRRQRIINY